MLLGSVIVLTACGSVHRLTAYVSPLATPTAIATPAAAATPTADATPSSAPATLPSPSPVAAGPVPARNIWDLDVVGQSLGFTLGWVCSEFPVTPTTQCKYVVAPSVESGPLHPIGRVGPQFSATDGNAPRSVHFLNLIDGFAYGHALAFVTHDAAQTWADSGLPTFEVVSITGRENVAWAVTRDCANATTCPFSVRSSTDAGRVWSLPYALPDGFSPVDATTFGSGGVVAWSRSDLVLTSDGGNTWSQIKSQCAGDLALRDFAVTPDGRQMWQLCDTLTATPGSCSCPRMLGFRGRHGPPDSFRALS